MFENSSRFILLESLSNLLGLSNPEVYCAVIQSSIKLKFCFAKMLQATAGTSRGRKDANMSKFSEKFKNIVGLPNHRVLNFVSQVSNCFIVLQGRSLNTLDFSLSCMCHRSGFRIIRKIIIFLVKSHF